MSASEGQDTVRLRPRRWSRARPGGVRVGVGADPVDGVTDRAVRLLLVLAESYRSDPGRLVTAEELTRGKGITARHLERLVGPLRDAGLLYSRRGREGGYRLVVPPERISLIEVVRAMDRDRGAGGAHAGSTPAYRGAARPLTELWAMTGQALEVLLGGITIADVLDAPQPARPGRTA